MTPIRYRLSRITPSVFATSYGLKEYIIDHNGIGISMNKKTSIGTSMWPNSSELVTKKNIIMGLTWIRDKSTRVIK